MRYFYFSYVWEMGNEKRCASFNVTSDEGFPPLELLNDRAKEICGESHIAIISWQEFESKEDYENFIK